MIISVLTAHVTGCDDDQPSVRGPNDATVVSPHRMTGHRASNNVQRMVLWKQVNPSEARNNRARAMVAHGGNEC